MERSDLLSANGGHLPAAGQGPQRRAKRDVKVLVVGNPANTSALIAQSNAPDSTPRRFTAMTRLDHNRAVSLLAGKLGVPVTDVNRMAIWGNHSTTQYPNLFHCQVGGKSAYELVGDHEWVDGTFIPTVAKRGAAIIEARGASSAASAANAAIDHMRSWALGTPRVTGSPWPCARTAATASPRADLVVPLHVRGRRVPDRPGAGHRRLLAPRSTPARPSWPTKRDAVRELDLLLGVLARWVGSEDVATRQARAIMSSTPRFSSSSLMRVDSSPSMTSLTVRMVSASTPRMAAIV